jgi:hypothetical protein
VSAVERGTGIVSLEADVLRGDYLCQWYGGADDDVLAERGRAGSARTAVRWALARSPRVQILTGAGDLLWAGTAPRPDEISGTWTDDGELVGRMPVP